MTQKYIKIYPTTDDIGKTPIVVEDAEGLDGVNIEFSRTSDETTINSLLTKTAQIATNGQSLEMTGNVVGANVLSTNETRLAAIENKAIFNQVNVKDYGAVGDGVTDDTSAIQDAIDYAESLTAPIIGTTSYNQSSIRFPTGNYLVSSSLNISGNGISLIGDDMGGATISITSDITIFDVTGINVSFRGIRLFSNTTNGFRLGVGIYLHDNMHKSSISQCEIVGLDIGILASGSWTHWWKENTIWSCRIGISCLRRSDEGETTTVNILSNSIFYNDEYNIAIGLDSETNWESGTSCTSLNIKDNMLDNSSSYIGNTVRASFYGNHTESTEDSLLIIGADGNNFVREIEVSNNYLLGNSGSTAVKVIGDDVRTLSFKENTLITHSIGFNIEDIGNNKAIFSHNRYQSVTYPIVYPFVSSSKEPASNIYMEGDEYTRAIAGKFYVIADTEPSTGRYKVGTIYQTKMPTNSSGGQVEQIFSFAENKGFCRVDARSDTASADAGTNIVTPADITKYRDGDRIVIAGAGTAGAAMSTYVRNIDYVAGTFQPDVTIKTTITNQAVTWSQGTWENL